MSTNPNDVKSKALIKKEADRRAMEAQMEAEEENMAAHMDTDAAEAENDNNINDTAAAMMQQYASSLA